MEKIQPSGPVVAAVAELQGLYGAFLFPEKLLQKIWLRGDYDGTDARTVDGRRLEILHPGRWNLLGGPDFRAARLRIEGGREFVGDVEIHVRCEDWAAHAHASDPAYDDVVLHVVLFPPDRPGPTRGRSGQEIPTLVMLPLLQRDLEQFAAEDAVEGLSGRTGNGPPDELVALAADELAALLGRHARERWRQKVHFAGSRILRLGWSAACHHTALEILGYRFNRAPMLRVASQWPLEAWGKPGFSPEVALASEKSAWSTQGVRPANRPGFRLRQYLAWVNASPDWPEKLRGLGAGLPESDSAPADETAAFRRAAKLSDWRAAFAGLAGNAMSGTRLDSLICDGCLPLLAAEAASARSVEALWFHWWLGDQPSLVLAQLRQLGVVCRHHRPACQGSAQGLIGWQIEREARG